MTKPGVTSPTLWVTVSHSAPSPPNNERRVLERERGVGGEVTTLHLPRHIKPLKPQTLSHARAAWGRRSVEEERVMETGGNFG